MRTLLLAAIAASAIFGPADAKDKRTRIAAAEALDSTDQKQMLDELRTLLKPSPLRLKVMPGVGTKDVFPRWTHVVCIGCDPTPKGMRAVHTYPYRILAGVLAGDDDKRERRGIPIPRTTPYSGRN